jgi:F0F1-type ATP synthase assembly protein I
VSSASFVVRVSRPLVNFFTRYAILLGVPEGDRRSETRARWARREESVDMPSKKPDSFISRSSRAFQDNVEQSGSAAGASYTLIGAIILLGGVGYALDRWRGSSPWFLLGGLIVGLVVGFYGLARTVWHK